MDTKFTGTITDPARIAEYLELAGRPQTHPRSFGDPVEVRFNPSGRIVLRYPAGTPGGETAFGNPLPVNNPNRKVRASDKHFRAGNRLGVYTRCSTEQLEGRAGDTPLYLGTINGAHLGAVARLYTARYPDFPRDRFPLLFSRIPDVAAMRKKWKAESRLDWQFCNGPSDLAQAKRDERHAMRIQDNREARQKNPRISRAEFRVEKHRETVCLHAQFKHVCGWILSKLPEAGLEEYVTLQTGSTDSTDQQFTLLIPKDFLFDRSLIRARIEENPDIGIRAALLLRKIVEVQTVAELWEQDRLYSEARSRMCNRNRGWDSEEKQAELRNLLTALHDSRYRLLTTDGLAERRAVVGAELSATCHCPFFHAAFESNNTFFESAVQTFTDAFDDYHSPTP